MESHLPFGAAFFPCDSLAKGCDSFKYFIMRYYDISEAAQKLSVNQLTILSTLKTAKELQSEKHYQIYEEGGYLITEKGLIRLALLIPESKLGASLRNEAEAILKLD